MAGSPIWEPGTDWCILRMSGPRTLAVATSLATTGFDVWTPVEVLRKKGRGKTRNVVAELPVALTPTFVFARADRVFDLIREAGLPTSAHPAFSVLRHRDRIPLVGDRALAPLREEEDRRRVRHLKTKRKTIAAGTSVTLSEGAFAGMTGVVERGSGKQAVVNFGGGFVVSIATYLIDADVLRAA